MSVFRVNLTNKFGGSPLNPGQGQANAKTGGQGNMDEIAQAGTSSTTYSIQRTMFAMGPNKVNRKLNDGDTFTDCNFWKRYSTSVLPADSAFITVVTDDGAPYIDGQVSSFPRMYSVTVGAGSLYAANTVDIVSDNGGPAVFAQITNNGGQSILVKLNGLSTATFTLTAGSTQSYTPGEFLISSIAFQDPGGGASSAIIQLGIQSTCNS
jgi:hypothetical protein